jgi:hypothetical protein
MEDQVSRESIQVRATADHEIKEKNCSNEALPLMFADEHFGNQN